MQLARSLTCSLTRPTTYVKEWGLSYLEKSPRNYSTQVNSTTSFQPHIAGHTHATQAVALIDTH
jgi:hypothetical protein